MTAEDRQERDDPSGALERRVETLSKVVPPDALALLSLRSMVMAFDEVYGDERTDAAYGRIFTSALDEVARMLLAASTEQK